MPNKPSPDKQAITFRFRRDLLATAKQTAAERGETLTAVVERALRDYTTTPPAQR